MRPLPDSGERRGAGPLVKVGANDERRGRRGPLMGGCVPSAYVGAIVTVTREKGITMNEITKMDRRSFVAGTAAMGALAAAGVAGAAVADEAPAVEWADEADVVIVGTGCAGMSAALTMAIEGLGSCLVLEVAPRELRGGNSGSTAGIVFSPDSVDAAIEYQNALSGAYACDEETMQVWAENLLENIPWMTEHLGCEFKRNEQGTWGIQGEYPFMPRAQECPSYNVTEGTTWQVLAGKYDELEIPTYYETRAVRLITNEAGEVVGVETEDGRSFKANKAVLLASGGFEANPEMMKTYLPAGYPDVIGKGSWYNRGDGIKMAQALGAELSHMSNVSGAALGLKMMATDDVDSRTWTRWHTHGYIWVDSRGRRFQDEDVLYTELLRHGKQYRAGTFTESSMPAGAWAIFTQEEFDGGCIFSTSCFAAMKAVDGRFTENQEALDAGVIVKCDTIDDLATATGIDAAQLQKTIDRYNGMVAAGEDTDFGRGLAKNEYSEPMNWEGNEEDVEGRAAFDLVAIEAPYYCVQLVGTLLNTQGGPKRSANCEVIDVFGQPIPRLYSAGEMGCEYHYIYNVGGNIAEAISSGRLAARIMSALEPVA